MTSLCRKVPILVTCALSAWVLWILNLAAMAWYYEFRTGHPSYVPILGTLALLAVAGIALILSAVTRLICEPNRSRSIGWLLIGITPPLLAAAHLGSGAWILFRDRTPSTLPIKWAAATATSVADAVGRWRNPLRSSSERVLVLHGKAGDVSSELKQLDEHVVRMENLLEQSPAGTAHLFRGPVFDTNDAAGWYLCGLAVVERPEPKIGYIERHELAHVVIDRYCSATARPPTLLIEGWAEAQSGYAPGFLAKRAWEQRCRGERLSLSAMTSDAWYDGNGGHCYYFGGALVDYILRTHGAMKFLELYRTCRPETFPADVSRVLGVTLNELDVQYWEDVARRVTSVPSELAEQFANASLAEGIDRDEWREFAHGFVAELDRPQIEAEPVYQKIAFSYTRKGERITEVGETIHAGDRHRSLRRFGTVEELVLATPKVSCVLTKSADGSWSLDDWDSSGRRPADYWNNLGWIGGDNYERRRQLISEALHERNRNDLRIKKFEQDSTEQGSVALVEFTFPSLVSGEPCEVTTRLEVLPERSYAIREREVRRAAAKESSVESTRYEYPADDPHSARVTRSETRYDSGQSHFESEWNLLEHNLWTVDETVFDPQTYGVSQAKVDAPYRAAWYLWIWGAVAPVSLLSGMILLATASRRTATNPEPPLSS
jgi:hypothetical protein